jgi:hypothetical protein
MTIKGSATFIVLLLALAPPAHAGRPLATEDASVLEAKHCQLETWVDRSRVATDFWTAPACNFGANIEWQLGGARTREGGVSALTQVYAQGKTVFRSVSDHPWGAGLIVGAVRQPRRDTETSWGDPYINIPVSFQLGDPDRLLHLNAGWLRDRADRRNITIWGIAAEAKLPGTPFTVLGETYGENAKNPFFRIGGRVSAIEDRLDFDLTFVTRSGGVRADRFVSLGLYYKSAAFLP